MVQINKQQLKDYFRRGNKPTESQFEDLIDSNINLKDSNITIDTNQNIGLDVDNPIAKLHVNGTLQLEEKTDTGGSVGTVRWTGSDLVVKLENEDGATSWTSLTNDSGVIRIDEAEDRIGIGLNEQTPLSRLHLSGPVLIDNTTKHTNEAMLNVMGSVGIGTNQPESNFHIAATYNKALSGTVSGVQNDYNANLIGTVDGTVGNTTLTGTGTSFTSELAVHQKIRIDADTYTISSITDDTTLVLNENLISEVSGQPVSVCELTGTGTLFDTETTTGEQIQIGTNVYTILRVISATCIRLDKALLQDATNATVYVTGDLLKLQDIDEATVLTIDKEGNVGIGTTPSAGVKLEVNGNTSLGGNLDVTGDTSVSTLDSTGATSLATNGGAVNIASSGATTTVKGTLKVDKAVTLDTTLDVTGDTGIDGDFDIATDKFTVASSTGNTVTKGSLTVEGDINAQSDLIIDGNLTVNGTTTTTNSTTVTIDDPVLTLGGDTAPSSNDNKDRGIEFRYYDGQARVGFFGFDQSDKKFTFLTDATNSGEVFSGTDGALRIGSLTVSGAGDSSFTGNVGIGTTPSTGTKLHVDKGRLEITASDATGGGQNRFTGIYSPTQHNYKRAQLVLSSGYSDLVIASSQANDNHGSTLTFATYNPSNASDYKKWVINQGNWGSRKQMLDFGYSNSGSRIDPHSNINSTDTVLTLDGVNKRVGIGTTNPSAKLEVNGDINFTGQLKQDGVGVLTTMGTNIYANLRVIRNDGSGNTDDGMYIGYGNGGGTNGHLRFYANGTNQRMIIKADNGNVGIGTTNPGAKLEVRGNIRLSSSSSRFLNLNYNEPNGRFEVQMNTYSSHHGRANSNYHNKVTWNGDNNWDFLSDKRLKKNISKVENILDRLVQLQVVNYNWVYSDDNEPKMTGFIAQDVQPLFPTLVGETSNPDSEETTLTLKYNNFGVLAVGAIKELKDEKDTEIDNLQNKVNDLKQKNMLLNDRLNAIEEKLGLI